VVVAGQSVKI